MAAGLLAVVGLGTLGACSAQVQVASAPSAVIATAADCRAPQVLAALGLLDAAPGDAGPDDGGPDERAAADDAAVAPAHADAPAAGAVPDGFTPVAVLECAPGGALRDSQGTWTSVAETRREGDLGPLLAVLGRASAASPTAPAATCAPDGETLQLWLVDVLGQAVRVAMPTTACGTPSAAVLAAVDALTATDVATYPVRLVAHG